MFRSTQLRKELQRLILFGKLAMIMMVAVMAMAMAMAMTLMESRINVVPLLYTYEHCIVPNEAVNE